MEKISIIIPVYNVQEYLDRCLNSIINQTYKNIEILLIDDGSTDNSGKICDLYKDKDKRVSVIHKKNGGLSDARNVGIKNASGEYLSFVDSDDFVAENFIQELHSIITAYSADIAICGYEKGKKDFFSNRRVKKQKNIIFDSEEMLEQWHGKHKHIETMAWNKLYKKELFLEHSIEYPVGYYNEDVQTTHLLVEKANRIVITNKKLYYYYQRTNSIIRLVSLKSVEDNLYSQGIRLAYFKDKNYISAYHRLKIKLQKYYMVKYCQLVDCDIRERMLEMFVQNYKEILCYKERRIFDALIFILFREFHFIFGKIYFFGKKGLKIYEENTK